MKTSPFLYLIDNLGFRNKCISAKSMVGVFMVAQMASR